MSGVAIIRALLVTHAPLVAAVPATRIMAGDLPMRTLTDVNTSAISLKQVSAVTRKTVAMAESRRQIVERVQVTAITKTYPEKLAVLNLVRAALPLSRGTTAGVEVDSILPDMEGPDLNDPELSIFERSQDFIVTFVR